MIIKLKRREMLFYLSYVIVYISLFIGDVYNGGSLDTFARYLRICSYVLIFTSCINLKLKKRNFPNDSCFNGDITICSENWRFILEYSNFAYL